MSPALEAHMRILSAIPPERVRTHHWKGEEVDARHEPRSRSAESTKELHDAILRLHRDGWPNVAIAAVMEVTPMTVSKHLRGLIKAVRHA